MFRTFDRLIFANFLRRASVIGTMVLGSFGSKYSSLTALLFWSPNANGSAWPFSEWYNFPFWELSPLMYLVQGGGGVLRASAVVASRILSSPTFKKRICLLALDTAIGSTNGFFLCCLLPMATLVDGSFIAGSLVARTGVLWSSSGSWPRSYRAMAAVLCFAT